MTLTIYALNKVADTVRTTCLKSLDDVHDMTVTSQLGDYSLE